MAKYLLIESRDFHESREVDEYYDFARDLRNAGNDVTVYLVQNAVFAVKKGYQGSKFAQLRGATVYADDFSLRQRGIDARDVEPGAKVTSIGTLVDLLVQPDVKATWH